MISQNAETISYMPSIPERATASSQVLQEGAISHALWRDAVCTLVLILTYVVLMVFMNSINVQEEFRIQGIRREVMTMAKENDVMKLEVSRLEAPVRVQQIAESKLGMSLPLGAVYGGKDPVVPDQNRGR